MNETEYMRRALALAQQAEGHTHPNPMVGCVVVKDGRVIAEGYHRKCGDFHAERNALLNCTEDPAGADLYVTLEPCCHHGRTPPCTDIILEKGIRRVFVGALDVNPKVAGQGVQILRDHGVDVVTGILEEECREQNEVFFHCMTQKRPFVALKYAMSLDGKIACHTGDSKWITGPEARGYVQVLRNRYTGILAGIGTVLEDDPMLNCRMEGGEDPVRIVCDSALRIPEASRLVRSAPDIPTLVFCTEAALEKPECAEKAERLEAQGVTVLPVPADPDGHADAGAVLAELFRRDVDSVLCEGGGTLNGSLLAAGLVDKVYAFVGAKVIGGAGAKSPVEGAGAAVMADALKFSKLKIHTFGTDLLIEGVPDRKEGTLCSPD